MDRGQVTIFIILAIVAVGIMGLVIFRAGLSEIPQEYSDNKAANVQFQECARQLAQESFRALGETGLLYTDNHTDDLVPTAYYYYEGQLMFPTHSRLETELARYVEDTLPRCTDMLVGYKSISEPLAKVSAKIGEERISYAISYPAVLDDGRQATKLQDTVAVIDYDFSRIYETSKNIVKMTADNPEWVNAALLVEQPVNVTMSYLSADEVVYHLSDASYQQGYDFYFAVKVEA